MAYSYKKMIIFQPRKDSVNTGCYYQVGFVTFPVERVGVRRFTTSCKRIMLGFRELFSESETIAH